MPQDAQQSSGGSPSEAVRDNQQIQDDNQTSGESVPNRAANMEPAEGTRENAGGISNRPLEEETNNQERVPPRGESKEGGHA